MIDVPLTSSGVAGTYYAIARKGAQVQSGGAWVAYVGGSYASYAIDATDVGAGDFTASVLDDADRVYLKRQVGGTPAASDTSVCVWTPSGGGGASADDITAQLAPLVAQILDQLQLDPPTQTGSQQYRARKLVAGDTYGPTARRFTVSRHRSADWPLDLATLAWSLVAKKDTNNDKEGGTLSGTVTVGVATGDARCLEVAITDTVTAAAAPGRHVYAVQGVGTAGRWTVELGIADVAADPGAA